MKKIAVLLLGVIGLCVSTSMAQTTKKKLTISNTRIIQATQQTTLMYGGVNIVVPKGQTVLLGQRSDGLVVVRGNDLQKVQIDEATVSASGYSVFSVEPKSNIVFLNRGSAMTLTDASGVTATITPGQAVFANNAAITSETAPALQAAAAAETAAVAGTEIEFPAFVAESETTSTASEQATQDVHEIEEVLSPSAPH